MEQHKETQWIEDELKNTSTGEFTGERLPALKLEAGKIVTFTVDVSKPFGTYSGQDAVKAIIPVMHKDEKKVLWMNKKNPLYKELLQKIAKGQKTFKVSTTGTLKETRYALVEED